MSYDVTLTCGHCGSNLLDVNMTSNLSAAWTAAGAPLLTFDGQTGVQALPSLQRAINALRWNPEEYLEHSPTNGWGSLEESVEFLEKIRDAAALLPDGVIGVRH